MNAGAIEGYISDDDVIRSKRKQTEVKFTPRPVDDVAAVRQASNAAERL